MTESTAGVWKVEPWNYDYFGSEARSIYALTWALGLIHDPQFLDKAFANLKIETYCWNYEGSFHPILRLWDGGAFQMLLPQTLIKESVYSKSLDSSFKNYAQYILAEQERLGLAVPAAFSASDAGIDGESCGGQTGLACYNGKEGSPALVATTDVDLLVPTMRSQWDAVFTPHAAFLAAQANPSLLVGPLEEASLLSYGAYPLYRPGLGFMDADRVRAPFVGEVVPSMLSLDQEMIALSTAQILASDRMENDGFGPSARALHADPVVRRRLREFYARVDARMEKLDCR
jgi:hypothetical protein